VFTIGHSTHSIERFIELLDAFSITCVCDVRSTPYSRRNPQFNRETLRDSLSKRAISYVFLGNELGARTEDERCYVDGKVRYALLAATPSFRAGLRTVIEKSRTFTLAMMCAEKEPLDCHRTILVARHLSDMGMEIEHILATDESERHEDTVSRLVEMVGLGRNDMFLSDGGLVDEAYRLREDAIAYEDPAKVGSKPSIR
jgi:uncharacterized protein (DUF488 family)